MTGRMRIFIGTALAGFAVLISWAFFSYMFPPRAMSFAGGKPVALAQFQGTSPVGVPDELRDASMIEKGRYLTEAADCAACHTAAGGAPYAGGRPFDTGFGILYSPNITPDKETGIGTWSDADFIRALHKGIAKNGSHLYPAFPYESYTAITDEDVKAIKAYLFNLSPVRTAPIENRMEFPANQRWLMAFWSFFYNSDRRFEPYTNRSAQWNRGAYLVEALAHCGDCHTPRNLGQALDNRHKFGGAIIEGWRAYNITQDRNAGIGAWTDQQITDYLKTGHTVGRGSAGGPMAEAVDVSLNKIVASDIESMVIYLHSIPPVPSKDEPAPRSEAASNFNGITTDGDARGKQVFEGACVSCHGWSGKSLLTSDATLIGARSVNDPTATNVAEAILNGVSRPAPALSMPAFREAYSDVEVAAVSNYVTGRFGATRSRLNLHDVATLRAASATE